MKKSEEKISCGHLGAVRGAVKRTGISGEWRALDDGQYQFCAKSGAVLNYWKSTGTIYLDGPELARDELRALFLRRAIVVKYRPKLKSA
jgi:hypothetical protein